MLRMKTGVKMEEIQDFFGDKSFSA